MAWYWILQPVPVMVTGIVPIFAFPMLGIMNTYDTCKCYLTDMTAMLITAGMLMTITSHSRLDKRIATGILRATGPSHAGLLFGVCLSSMLLSMVGLRVLVMAMMMPILEDLMKKLHSLGQEAPYSTREASPGVTQQYANDMSAIYYMAAGTSAAIGSIGFVSSSYATMTFLAPMYRRYPMIPEEYSFMKMAMFTVPTMLLMMLLNYAYLALLLLAPGQNRRKLDKNARTAVQQYLNEQYKAVGRWTYHQGIIIFWMLVILAMVMLRAPCGFGGWDSMVNSEKRFVTDATVFGLFVLVLHSLPANLDMLKYFRYNKRSELPPVAPSPGILEMSYANLHTPWGYIFMIGAAVALMAAIDVTGTHAVFAEWVSMSLQQMPWWTALMLILGFTMFAANTTGFTVPCAMLMPLFVEIGVPTTVCPLIPPLALMLPASLNFTLPFRDTPPSAVQNKGHVRTKRLMAIGSATSAICAVVLFLMLYYYAPMLWTCESAKGICSVDKNVWDIRVNYTQPEVGKATEPPAGAAPALPASDDDSSL